MNPALNIRVCQEVWPPGGVTMSEAIQRLFSKYVDFSSRAPRSEYWWVNLAVILLYFVVGLVFSGVGPATSDAIFGLTLLGLILPMLAVTVRRLHDTGRTGWWVLLSLIPFVGPIVLIVFLATEGSHEPNQWGPPVSR